VEHVNVKALISLLALDSITGHQNKTSVAFLIALNVPIRLIASPVVPDSTFLQTKHRVTNQSAISLHVKYATLTQLAKHVKTTKSLP